jgi:hypothetical protein
MDNFEDEFLDEDRNNMQVLSPTNTVDLNALTMFWRPRPNNQRPIVDRILVSPIEESLLSLLIENHLPKRMYPAIIKWAHYASSQDYDFHHASTYQTVLGHMIKKYINVSGGLPKSKVMHVPNHAPMHVYCFDFLMQVTRLLSNPGLMIGSLWGHNCQVDPLSHERVYSAYVLPCVEGPGDDFPMKHNMAKYCLVFPPRSEWTNIW